MTRLLPRVMGAAMVCEPFPFTAVMLILDDPALTWNVIKFAAICMTL